MEDLRCGMRKLCGFVFFTTCRCDNHTQVASYETVYQLRKRRSYTSHHGWEKLYFPSRFTNSESGENCADSITSYAVEMHKTNLKVSLNKCKNIAFANNVIFARNNPNTHVPNHVACVLHPRLKNIMYSNLGFCLEMINSNLK